MDKKFKQQLKKDFQGKSMLSKTNWDDEILDDELYETEASDKYNKKKKKKSWKDQDRNLKNYKDYDV